MKNYFIKFIVFKKEIFIAFLFFIIGLTLSGMFFFAKDFSKIQNTSVETYFEKLSEQSNNKDKILEINPLKEHFLRIINQQTEQKIDSYYNLSESEQQFVVGVKVNEPKNGEFFELWKIDLNGDKAILLKTLHPLYSFTDIGPGGCGSIFWEYVPSKNRAIIQTVDTPCEAVSEKAIYFVDISSKENFQSGYQMKDKNPGGHFTISRQFNSVFWTYDVSFITDGACEGKEDMEFEDSSKNYLSTIITEVLFYNQKEDKKFILKLDKPKKVSCDSIYGAGVTTPGPGHISYTQDVFKFALPRLYDFKLQKIIDTEEVVVEVNPELLFRQEYGQSSSVSGDLPGVSIFIQPIKK